ncbi:MAG: hypothetical protein GC129_03300 [Proteobacteria bacterium]|nr:hypothetical protein [Pseudomonadota bacterium]
MTETVLHGQAGHNSARAKPDHVTCTPQEMIDYYGVPKLKSARLFANGICKPDGLALERRYRARQVIAPPGRNFQGRFCDAATLLMLGYPREEVDPLIREWHGHIDRSLERAHAPLHHSHAAVREARSLFPKKVKVVEGDVELLTDAKSNAKVGSYVVDGEGHAWGKSFTVGWEERATCPATCHHWLNCYTNNSPFMVRKHYDRAREEEILDLLKVSVEKRLRQVRQPYVYVRLHQSGDFPTVRYAQWWKEAIERYPRLMVFGYSHWPEDSAIGEVLARINSLHWYERMRIYTSNGGKRNHCANTFHSASAAKKAGNMPCLEQVGRSPSCGECQMCMPGPKSRGYRFDGSIGFIEHAVPGHAGQGEFDL